jgi:hypothetical protein
MDPGDLGRHRALHTWHAHPLDHEGRISGIGHSL